jgi:hypothetical protein
LEFAEFQDSDLAFLPPPDLSPEDFSALLIKEADLFRRPDVSRQQEASAFA